MQLARREVSVQDSLVGTGIASEMLPGRLREICSLANQDQRGRWLLSPESQYVDKVFSLFIRPTALERQRTKDYS